MSTHTPQAADPKPRRVLGNLPAWAGILALVIGLVGPAAVLLVRLEPRLDSIQTEQARQASRDDQRDARDRQFMADRWPPVWKLVADVPKLERLHEALSGRVRAVEVSAHRHKPGG